MTLTGRLTVSLLERRRVLSTEIHSSQPTRVSHRVVRGNTISRQEVGLTVEALTTGGPTHHGRRIGKAVRTATEKHHSSFIVQAVRTASSPHPERHSSECGRVLVQLSGANEVGTYLTPGKGGVETMHIERIVLMYSEFRRQ